MRVVKVILWICAIAFMLSFVAMFLPWSVIEKLYGIFGETPYPGTPAASYMLRVSSGIVGLIGIYFVMLAQNPARYRTLLIFTAIGLIACGVFCFVIGLAVGISPLFYIGDGLFGVILGIVLAIFIPRAEAQGTSPAAAGQAAKPAM